MGHFTLTMFSCLCLIKIWTCQLPLRRSAIQMEQLAEFKSSFVREIKGVDFTSVTYNASKRLTVVTRLLFKHVLVVLR